MNARSLKLRLVVWYAGVMTVVFVLLGGLMYVGLKMYLEKSLSEDQIRRAQQIAGTLLANLARRERRMSSTRSTVGLRRKPTTASSGSRAGMGPFCICRRVPRI
jgi:hypothetical protein